ncbi:hypothetical protein KBZ10_26090 [Streptomyces sp. F63]|uniref:hypothetical protein n=1 Tax=Streptomyces sp. F63 TaxID=2824887 RepID=UPI001B392437|nr:hypothetical protein [Streptomyces sp. F63]MBQ0987926.1 hypothetical protein [Streptomyces sp. F63]
MTYVYGDRLEQFRTRYLKQELSQQLDIEFIDLDTIQHVNRPSPSRQVMNVHGSGKASLQNIPYGITVETNRRPLAPIASIGSFDQVIQR